MSASNRAKRLVATRGIAIALVGVAAIGGAWTVYTDRPTETITEERNPQTFETAVRTSALVTGNTTLYREGTRLEDMPVYLTRASPNLRLTIVTNVPPDRTPRVVQQLDLIIVATRDGQPFFSEERSIIDRSTQVAGGNTTAAGTVNVSQVGADVSRIRNEIGTVGSLQIRFDLRVAYRTGQYQGELTASTPLQLSDGGYWLSGPLDGSRTHTTTVTRTVTQPPDTTTAGALGFVGLLAIAGAIAIGVGSRRIDVADLRTEVDHARFEEWISEGEFPTGADKRYIAINSLEDLVDVAIDSNKRVIFDPSLGIYAVTDGDLVYYFSRDPFNIDAWLDT